MKYRKKPVVIEAVRWTGNNSKEMCAFLGRGLLTAQTREGVYLRIETPEGVMLASEGDFVIKGVQGEFYPCKPDIFEATYEAVS